MNIDNECFIEKEINEGHMQVDLLEDEVYVSEEELTLKENVGENSYPAKDKISRDEGEEQTINENDGEDSHLSSSKEEIQVRTDPEE